MKKLLLTLCLLTNLPAFAGGGAGAVFEDPQVQSVQQTVDAFLKNPGERTLADLKAEVRAVHASASDADIQNAIADYYKNNFAESAQEFASAAADALNAFDAKRALKDLEKEIQKGIDKLKTEATKLTASKEAQKATTVVQNNIDTAAHGLRDFAKTGKLKIRFGHKKGK